MLTEDSPLDNTFSADEYIINIIQRAMANAQDILIDARLHGYIIILAKEGEFFPKVERLSDFCSLDANEFKVTVLNEKKLKPYKIDVGRNIDELLWHAGYYASNGQMMEGCHWNSVIRLKYWPNFTRLPLTPNSLRIAALLATHTASIESTILALNIKREDMYQFFCAAYCAGAISMVSDTEKPLKLKPHHNNALLGMLFSKIANM